MKNIGNAEYLCKMFVSEGLINKEQSAVALEELTKTYKFITTVLKELHYAHEQDLLAVMSSRLNIPRLALKDTIINSEALEIVPARFANHYKVVPISFKDNTLTIAVIDPLDIHTLDDLSAQLNVEICPVLASEPEIEEAMRKYYGVGADTLDKMISQKPIDKEQKAKGEEVQDVSVADETTSIITFVNQLLKEAVKEKATDIHLEPFEHGLRARFRVDGILYDISLPQSIEYFHSLVVSRIKIMASLDIAERRVPQDGRIKIKVEGQDLDLRISIIPTRFGEAVHIRILSPYFFLGLENLGFSNENLVHTEQVIRRPHGIILVTGPTGSGKSTTLYACLARINSDEVKIVTIEDPVEYQLKGVMQIQVSPRTGLSFAQGLRHMLRHDPDVMMIGEIRDHETAEIAVRAALTGHLVFSTLHTNDAAGAVARLIDMDFEPFLLASSLECLIAQRLVRLICPSCKQSITPSQEHIDKLRDAGFTGGIVLYKGKGCKECRFTGYKGRTGIYEVLRVTEPIRELIPKRAPSQQIKDKAVSLGMHTLCQDGFRKVLMGLTTMEEVLRVTQEEDMA